MTAYDLRKGERFAQMHTPGPEVDMVDAPSREPPEPPRAPPRKLEIRQKQGSGETTQGLRRNHELGRPVSTYGYSYTSRTTCEIRRRSQSDHTLQRLQASVSPGRVTMRRAPRNSFDDENYHRFKHDQDYRRNAEDEFKALSDSYRSLKFDLEVQIGRREKAEKDFCDSDSRLAAQVHEASQTQQSLADELQRRDRDLRSAQGQLELIEKQRDNERAQRISESQQQESERQQWEFERHQWDSKEKQYVTDKDGFKSLWKKVAKELNGLRAQGQGFYQVTDNYLYDLIIQLRYKVRDFGIQYFSDKLPKRPKFEPNRVWKENMVPTTRDESYLDLVNCSETRPSVIQAFMWRVIVQEVFCKFRWAGTASSPVTQLCKDLEPCLNGGFLSPANIEATKRFHTWRATTVGLLLDSMDEQKRRQADVELQKWMSEVHDEAHVNLRLLGPNDQKGCQQGFLDIIDEAVKIDKEISRQVSRVTWTFGSEDVIQTLDLASMELRKGEVFKPKSKVTLVTSPGVIKQGKSTGEGFESSFDLLKMEVSCETAASWQ